MTADDDEEDRIASGIGKHDNAPETTGSSRPAVLYLVHRVPFPPDKGDRIRTFHLLKMLSRRASVHLACLADEPPSDEAVAALRGYCERVEVVRLAWSRWPRPLVLL